jgi:hypothetical protein
MSPASDEHYLGEYRLKELICENVLTRTWLAEQVSVARRVLVDELRPEQENQREVFLADIRAKAAVEHPLVASVYEAVAEPGQCYYAHELLPDATLHDAMLAGTPIKPARFAHLIRRIAEAHLQHESLAQATLPMGLENIHVDEQGGIRLDNLAIAGQREAGQSERDIVHLGAALQPLVADHKAGTTRMFTLLSWMRGEGIEAPLVWTQVRDICMQIEQQLVGPMPAAVPTKPAVRSRKKTPIIIIAGACGLAMVFILILVLRNRPEPPRPHMPSANGSDTHLIPAGKHPTPDGTDEALQAFRIAAHEVTIGQYAEFIELLETLAQDQRHRTFDHESQPPSKTSHVPDDWATLLAAAKAGTAWNQRPVTIDCPVVGVDWWDCSAYAEWKQGRLATQEEWFAALRHDLKEPASIQPVGWLPIGVETTDRTPKGICGMAGSVSEWARRPAPNPANPLGARKWVIIGGSYLKPGSNALTREWIDDRSLRRPDLGFRLVFDPS